MRGARFFGLVLFFVITYISLPSTLQAASEWNDTVINRQIDFPSNPDTREMGTCAYFDTNKVLLKEIETQNSPLISYKYTNTTEEILQPLGDYCLTRSNAGYHWPGFWAPDLDTPEKMYELRNTQGDLWFAPNSDSYLYLQPYPRITYARYLSFNSGFKAGTNGKFTTRTIGSGVSALEQKGFTVDPASFTDAYRYSDNQYVVLSFQGIWFSANGRYAAVMVYGQGFAMIDLQTRSYTPFAISKSTTMPFLDINVDSYGRYVVVDSGLPVVYDLTLCTSYSDGNWPSNGFANLPATCVPSYNSAADLVPYTSNYTKSLGSWITPDGLRFIHDRTNPATGQNIRLEFYPASRANSLGEPNGAEGYLAMGDSYSSGEGAYDYEPGTDEKGDISTYAERNMCHISRKSYSYLLAMELGYLLDNSSQPPADGLFHSVACSGAKTHNIIGSPLGEKQSDGTQEEFTSTNNQYRFSASSLMEEWQSGISTQESFLHPGLLPDNLNRKGYSNPEQITLGIGGNDAFFSDFIQA
ncbi:hypothetical protein KC878_02355, partial [Candidatus Saccharibacteria bacterium]|nr:hypothetical protein [Candidatus Saccharibacteria bacterium]